MNRITAKELGIFAEQLYFAFEAGFPVSRGITIIKQRGRIGRRITDIDRAIHGGESLHSALEKTNAFPAFFVTMTRVGEESGKLAEVMSRMADYYNKEARMADELKNAMLYPIIVSVLMLGVIISALLVVIPGYARIFEANNTTLPAMTSALITLSEFIINHGLYTALIFLLTLLLARRFFSFGAGEWFIHRLLLTNKTYVKAANQRFAHALGLMLVSGNELVFSATVAKNTTGNRVMASRLQTAIELVLRGTTLSSALESTHAIDAALLSMIKLGEETGQLPITVSRCANYLQRELDTQIARISRLAEPLATLLLGAVLVFVMLAIMLPTFQMADIL